MRRLLTTLCSFLLLATTVFSQTTNEGTDFWFGFMENREAEPWPIMPEVYVTTGEEDAVVTISNPAGDLNIERSVAANSTEVISLPVNFIPTTEGISSLGLHLTSDVAVSVYLQNRRLFSIDAAVALPTVSLGQEYRVMAHMEPEGDGTGNNLESQLLVVSTANGTQIEITPSVETLSGLQAGVPLTIELNQGEIYQLKSNQDLTGTLVNVTGQESSCAPIAVFGGNKFTNVGGCGGNHDFLMEQITPLSSWGRNFLYVPFRSRGGGDYVKILAAEDGTEVEVAGNGTVTLNAGEWTVYKTLLGIREIKASKPILVGQFSRSTACDGIEGDPFMLLLSPLSQRINEVSFNTLKTENVNRYYLTLITTFEGESNVRLDGELVGFSRSVDYAYASLQISEGRHEIVAPEGVVAYTYGFGPNESYGLSAGLRLNNQSFQIVSGDQDDGSSTLEVCFGQSLALSVMADEQTNLADFGNFVWDLGDGTTIEGEQIEHTYTALGTYTVTFTAEKEDGTCGSGTTATASKTIEVSDLGVGEIIGPNSVCPDLTNAEYVVSGTADFDYQWFVTGGMIVSSPNNASIQISWGSANENAMVSVLVDNKQGCVIQRQLMVNVQANINPAAPAGTTEFCGTDSYTGFYSPKFFNIDSEYEWFAEGGVFPRGNTGSPVEVLWDGPGTPGRLWYREVNRNIAECQGMSEVLEVTIYEELSVQVTTTDVSCFGMRDGAATIEVSGGKPGDIRIQFGADEITGNTINELAQGNYSLTVIDELNCIINVNFAIFEPSQLEMDLDLTNVSCFQEANGSIMAEPVGGTTPYTYSINNGGFQDSPLFSGLRTGSYSVIVRDANGCTFTRNASINEPPLLELRLEFINGTVIRAEALGGTPDYMYSIDGTNFQESREFEITSGGDYTVTVRDANGCTSMTTIRAIITSTDPSQLQPKVSSYPNPTSDLLIISEVEAGDAIQLVDVKGNVLKSVAIKTPQTNYELSVANLGQPILLVRVSNKEGRVKLYQKVLIRE